jgi:SAM-dependent methyltransferase
VSTITQKLDTATFLVLMSDDVNTAIHGRVLDAGCGRMPYKRFFPDCEWVGADIRPVGDIEADLHELTSALSGDPGFDTVLCTNVLHECGEPFAVVAELAACLKPGGALILVAPQTLPADEEPLWTFPARGLELLARAAGLRPVALKDESGLMRTEYDAWLAQMAGAPLLPVEHEAFIDRLNHSYPILSALVAVK